MPPTNLLEYGVQFAGMWLRAISYGAKGTAMWTPDKQKAARFTQEDALYTASRLQQRGYDGAEARYCL